MLIARTFEKTHSQHILNFINDTGMYKTILIIKYHIQTKHVYINLLIFLGTNGLFALMSRKAVNQSNADLPMNENNSACRGYWKDRFISAKVIIIRNCTF